MSDNSDIEAQRRALERRLNALPASILAALRPALMLSGKDLARTMKTLAEPSRDTGALIKSIAVTGPGETTPAYAANGGKRTAAANQVLVTVGNEDVRYAHLVEFGTVESEAQPFFRPAWQMTKLKIMKRMDRAGRTAIRKWARQ